MLLDEGAQGAGGDLEALLDLVGGASPYGVLVLDGDIALASG
ncbi:MAG: hypothetical protein ACRDNS_14400 [Trebonia sp.]